MTNIKKTVTGVLDTYIVINVISITIDFALMLLGLKLYWGLSVEALISGLVVLFIEKKTYRCIEKRLLKRMIDISTIFTGISIYSVSMHLVFHIPIKGLDLTFLFLPVIMSAITIICEITNKRIKGPTILFTGGLTGVGAMCYLTVQHYVRKMSLMDFATFEYGILLIIFSWVMCVYISIRIHFDEFD